MNKQSRKARAAGGGEAGESELFCRLHRDTFGWFVGAIDVLGVGVDCRDPGPKADPLQALAYRASLLVRKRVASGRIWFSVENVADELARDGGLHLERFGRLESVAGVYLGSVHGLSPGAAGCVEIVTLVEPAAGTSKTIRSAKSLARRLGVPWNSNTARTDYWLNRRRFVDRISILYAAMDRLEVLSEAVNSAFSAGPVH